MYRILMILLGNTIYALGVVLFIVPNGLVTGGTTGLGLAALHFLIYLYLYLLLSLIY